MTLVARHGGASHTVRPDRVYRTSVLAPMYGYSPGVDVQEVAFAFTQPPQGLAGFEGSWFDRLRLRIKAAWYARKANKFMAANTAGVSGLGTPSPGPAPSMVNMIAPQMEGPMSMWASIVQTSNARSVYGPVANATRTLSMRRPYTWYRAG